jgi:hypothetical protein
MAASVQFLYNSAFIIHAIIWCYKLWDTNSVSKQMISRLSNVTVQLQFPGSWRPSRGCKLVAVARERWVGGLLATVGTSFKARDVGGLTIGIFFTGASPYVTTCRPPSLLAPGSSTSRGVPTGTVYKTMYIYILNYFALCTAVTASSLLKYGLGLMWRGLYRKFAIEPGQRKKNLQKSYDFGFVE